MSSDSRDRKVPGLAGQIEIEIIRDSHQTEDLPLLSSGTNPLLLLKRLAEQAEELEQVSAEACLGLPSPAEMQQQLLARFQKQNVLLARKLTKLN